MHAFCVRRVGRARADDATAEAFMVVWRRLDDIPGGLERAWLFGIARNVVRNTWRSSARAARAAERIRGIRATEPRPPEELILERADSPTLRCPARLVDRDQEVLMLSAWEGLSGAEMAHVLGVSVNTVHQRLHRAKKRLAQQLSKTPEAVSRISEEGAV